MYLYMYIIIHPVKSSVQWTDPWCAWKSQDIHKGLNVNFPENVGTEFDLMCYECGHI